MNIPFDKPIATAFKTLLKTNLHLYIPSHGEYVPYNMFILLKETYGIYHDLLVSHHLEIIEHCTNYICSKY